MGKNRHKTLTDIMLEQIQKHNIETSQQWDNEIDQISKLELIREFCLLVDSYIQKIIRIHKTSQNLQIKNSSFTQIHLNALN